MQVVPEATAASDADQQAARERARPKMAALKRPEVKALLKTAEAEAPAVRAAEPQVAFGSSA